MLIAVDLLNIKIKIKELLNLDSDVALKGILIEHIKVITERMKELKKMILYQSGELQKINKHSRLLIDVAILKLPIVVAMLLIL